MARGRRRNELEYDRRSTRGGREVSCDVHDLGARTAESQHPCSKSDKGLWFNFFASEK